VTSTPADAPGGADHRGAALTWQISKSHDGLRKCCPALAKWYLCDIL